jgi:hypothetical protein
MVVGERLFFLDSRCLTADTLIFGLTDGREGCGGCVAMLRRVERSFHMGKKLLGGPVMLVVAKT